MAAVDLPRIIAGLLLSTLIGGVAYRRGSLSGSGWLGAILTGTCTFGFGGWAWGATLVAFFVSSTLLSRFKQRRKEHLVGEKFAKGGRRDLGQTLANGGPGAVLAVLYAVLGEPLALLALFSGIMATVTADTWATELGVLNRSRPRLITTLQPVAAGTSGGISLTGTLASAAGALLIGGCMLVLYAFEQRVWLTWLPLAALIGGMAGSFADSLLGATVQAMYRTQHGEETERSHAADRSANQPLRGIPWLNNDAVNFLSSLAGGIAAWGVYRLLY